MGPTVCRGGVRKPLVGGAGASEMTGVPSAPGELQPSESGAGAHKGWRKGGRTQSAATDGPGVMYAAEGVVRVVQARSQGRVPGRCVGKGSGQALVASDTTPFPIGTGGLSSSNAPPVGDSPPTAPTTDALLTVPHGKAGDQPAGGTLAVATAGAAENAPGSSAVAMGTAEGNRPLVAGDVGAASG